MFSNAKKILDIVKYRWVCIAVSVLLLIPAIGSMIYSTAKYGSPLLVGIDFTGGTIIQYTVNEKVANSDVANIRTKLTSAEIENPVIQILSSSDVTKNDTTNIISVKTAFDGEKDTHMTETVTSNIQGMYPDAQLVQVSSVGPTLGKELLQNSIIAIVLALIAISAYLTIRFKLEFAVIALLTLCHDVLFVLGVFSILGLFRGVHVDSLFITAILTVLGYSINDTIVVFDRIRENIKFSSKSMSIFDIINASINQTIARSINTSVTTLLTLGALYFFGGVTTKDFVLAMMLGIAVGTYSSIFFASTLLVIYHKQRNTKVLTAV